MLLEDQRSNVWQLADAVDDGELNVRIVFRDALHDRRLCKSNTDDEIEISLGESAHRGFDCVWCTGFDIAQDYRKILCGTLHTFPRRGIERSVVLSADVENDSDVDLRWVASERVLATGHQQCRREEQCKSWKNFVFHSLMISLTNFNGCAAGSSPM